MSDIMRYKIPMYKAVQIAEAEYKLTINEKKSKLRSYSSIEFSIEFSQLLATINKYKRTQQEKHDSTCKTPYKYPLETKLSERMIIELIQVDFSYATKKIREKLYKEGFIVNNKCHFVRYKRSAGSARDNKCYFIYEPLKEAMDEWSAAGLHKGDITNEEIEAEAKLLDVDASVIEDDARFEKMAIGENTVSYESYNALTLSTMKTAIHIPREAILLVPDVKSVFSDRVNSVSSVSEESLVCETKEVEITNTIWDGEGFLDEDCFPKIDGRTPSMMLLRNKFFKSCVFNTKLQKWFEENNIQLPDLKKRGFITKASKIQDIKLVITKSSLKYLKFTEDTERGFYKWLNYMSEDFGVVKTDHKSHFFDGNMVNSSYQLLNTVQFNPKEVAKFMAPALDYREKVHTDRDVFLYHIRRKIERNNKDEGHKNNGSYRFHLMKTLLEINEDFFANPLTKDFKRQVTDSIREDMKKGRFLINGVYATLMGNGYEMLRYLKGEFKVDSDNEVQSEASLKPGQIYCPRYKDKQTLFCIRNPHVTMGNIYLPTNSVKEEYEKWFNLSDEIVCVNSVNENIMQRLNGCDFDSDTMLITDNSMLVSAAKKYYDKFLVPYCDVKEEENPNYAMHTADDKIGNNQVGLIINLSQTLNSMYWDRLNTKGIADDELYKDICILAVLSNMEIDGAKRLYKVNTQKVINEIKSRYQSPNESEKKVLRRPLFLVRGGYFYETTMNYVSKHVSDNPLSKKRPKSTKFYHLISEDTRPDKTQSAKKQCKRAIELVEEISNKMVQSSEKRENKDLKNRQDYLDSKQTGYKASYRPEDLGQLNEERRSILEEYEEKMSKCFNNKNAVFVDLINLDEWIETYSNQRNKSEEELNEENKSTEEVKKERNILNKIWVFLYYLMKEDNTYKLQDLIVRNSERKNLKMTDHETKLKLFDFYFNRVEIKHSIVQGNIVDKEKDDSIDDNIGEIDNDDDFDNFLDDEEYEDLYYN